MLNLPKSTEVNLPLYKKDILQNFEGTQKQKDVFNNSIQSLRIVNELSSRSLPIEGSKDINGIFIIEVILKNPDIKEEIINLIFKLIPQHIILILYYEDSLRLAIHHKNTFITEPKQTDFNLKIEGLSVDEVWQHLVETIGNFKVEDGSSLDEKIVLDFKIQAILKEIEKLEAKQKSTKTPRIKYEIHQQIEKLKEKAQQMSNG